MPGYIEDRWWSKRPDPATGKKYKLSRYGQGQRYRVCGIPGVKDESFRKLDEAKDWLASAQTDSRRGDYLDPDFGRMLLHTYVETIWWPGVTVAVGTRTTMRQKIWKHVLGHLGHVALADIDEQHLRLWVAKLYKTQQSSTAHVIWSYLSEILATAVGKRIKKNPCTEHSSLRPKPADKKARALRVAQVGALRDLVPPRNRILMDLGLGAGLRQGEAIAISPGDIDAEAAVLRVRRQIQWEEGKDPYFKLPKGDKERDVPLSGTLHKLLDAYAREFAPVEIELPWHGPGATPGQLVRVPLLVVTRFKNQVNPNHWNRDTWKPALQRAGIIRELERAEGEKGPRWEASREWGFHCLRHTYASVQLHAGESVVSLSRWLGHSTPTITLERYAHFMPEAGEKGRSAIDAWLSGAL